MMVIGEQVDVFWHQEEGQADRLHNVFKDVVWSQHREDNFIMLCIATHDYLWSYKSLRMPYLSNGIVAPLNAF